MSHTSNAEKLLHNVRNSLVWGDTELEEALHNGIDGVFPFASDERKAELFTQLLEGWESNPDGVLRKLWLRNVIEEWQHKHIFATPPAQEEQTDA